MFENNFDDEIDIEAEFVGRENDLNVLKTAWQKHKIFGIFGLRSVGKSRLDRVFKKYKVDR
jgi:AAA+ ATPase superfamily predicted ATPase